MAQITLSHPIDTLTGKLSKNERIVYRQKMAYAPNGSQIAACAPEAYVISKPRDWKKTPATGAELAKIQRFQQACRLTQQALADNSPTKNEWEQRWLAQLKRPEADAPIDKRTGHRKIYGRLDNYVRAHILRSLQSDL